VAHAQIQGRNAVDIKDFRYGLTEAMLSHIRARGGDSYSRDKDTVETFLKDRFNGELKAAADAYWCRFFEEDLKGNKDLAAHVLADGQDVANDKQGGKDWLRFVDHVGKHERYKGGLTDEVVANDGGHVYGGGAATMPEDFVENGPANRGRILAFLHKPEYTYVAGDATRYFRPGKVKEHQRAFLHVQPDLFIVFDRVEASDPAFKKRWLLHTEAKPEVAGARQPGAGARQPDAGASLTVKNGEGVLWCSTLLPADPEVVVVEPMVLADRNEVPKVDITAYPPGYPSQWRIEISPKSASARDCFLHVLCVPTKGVEERPQATVEDTADAATVTVKWAGRTVKVRFPKTGALVGHLTITGADGKTVVDEDLPQKIQTNAELVQAQQRR
jgi:hypothetical protein